MPSVQAVPQGPFLSDELDLEDSLSRRRKFILWLVIALLSLLLHLTLFVVPWEALFPKVTSKPAPVEVRPMDTETLEKIREEWSKKEKSLLLSKDKSKVTPSEKPKDARFMSDRNRIVEQEQRARYSQVLPQPNVEAPPFSQQESATKKARPKPAPKALTIPVPELSQLGVPFTRARMRADESTEEAENVADRSRRRMEAGGDQALLDRSLPMGSENLLNTEQSVYYSFYARLYESIGPVWQSHIRDVARTRRIPPGTYITQVDVVFDARGQLLEVRFLEGSGIQEFDRAVETSWRKITRFPNPPRDLLDAQGEIHTGWTFHVDINENFNILSGPPSREY